MPHQSNFCYSSSHQTPLCFIFKQHHGAFFILLVCLIGLLSTNLFAQPLAKGKSKFLGNVISNGNSIRSDFKNYWNQVTPENAGKWESVEGTRDQYNWAQLDKIYDYAITNGFLYKHHALVWGSQYPTWITSLDSANQRAQVEEWIRLVGARYPNMNFVDVVNEPFNKPLPFANALGGSGATGWDWVITSFRWARQYCAPGVKLVLNEYNILGDNTATGNYLRLIDTLRVRGLIDCIGVQGHYFEFKGSGYARSASTIRANLDRLAATGLPIYITEFDINEPDDNIQLQSYQTYFSVFWQHPAVKGITLWGYVESDIWKVDAFLITARNAERPALQWLRTYVLTPLIPTLVSPINAFLGVPRNPSLVWQASNSATSYHVQVSTQSTFPSSEIIVDTTIVDTLIRLNSLAANSIYYWRVNAANNDGTSDYSTVVGFATTDQITSVNETGGVPTEFKLAQNFPNPFNPTTVIGYELPVVSSVSIKVYNLVGQEITTLFDGIRQPGNYKATFDGAGLTSGVYFYRLYARSQDGSVNFNSVKKLLYLR